MGRLLVITFVMSACGFEVPPAAPIDGPGDTPDMPMVDMPMVDDASRIVELATPQHESDPAMTPDLLELFFLSDRPGSLGGRDIWTSRRASTTSAWAPPTRVINVNSASNEGPPEISNDGLILLYSSDQSGGAGGQDIYFATRANRSAPFSTGFPLAVLSSSADDFAPFLRSDGLVLILTSLRDGSADLWTTSRSSPTAVFPPPVKIVELSSPAADSNAWASSDGLRVTFNSDRPGSALDDLWMATRTSSGSPWDAPTRIANLSGVAIDSGPWISPDGSTILFASSRGGDLDLYQATAP